MKKVNLPTSQINQVLRLRQNGISWLGIQTKTGIPRRIAKRVYENWEHNQSLAELKEARKDVAAEEFRKHLDSLIMLARVLVNHLDVSVLPNETRDANKMLDVLFAGAIYEEFESDTGVLPKSEKEQRRLIRQNQLRFRSLQGHTREKVRWQSLEEWKQAWNACVRILAELHAEAQEVVENILDDQKPKVRDKIKKSKRGKAIIEDMASGVAEAIWRSILAGKPEEGYNLVRTRPDGEEATLVLFGEQASIVSVRLTDKDLAEEVANICVWAAENLCKGDLVQRPADSIRTMQAKATELEMMLDSLRLRPLILRTRCELCPA